MLKQKQAYLLLENGTLLKGKTFGAERETMGEVVFNTAMTGYQEILSDPSYCGQIVTMTYPLIGNYGINRDDFESITPSIDGLIVKEHCLQPSHWRSEKTLDQLLTELDIPGLHDIDTRRLTRMIREQGTMKGMIVPEDKWDPSIREKIIAELQGTDLPSDQVPRVSTKNSFHCPGRKQNIVLVDFGTKASILRVLTNWHCDIRVVPYDITAEELIRLRPDGVVLSNGPGDPRNVPGSVRMLQGILGKLPIFGIGLGHQLLALACGAQIKRLKVGHRGANHPVKDINKELTLMTSQNHSYTVDPDSLPGSRLEVSHVAINDQSIEGMKHLDHPVLSVQFHPELLPGSYNSHYLFDQFIEQVEEHTQKEEAPHATL